MGFNKLNFVFIASIFISISLLGEYITMDFADTGFAIGKVKIRKEQVGKKTIEFWENWTHAENRCGYYLAEFFVENKQVIEGQHFTVDKVGQGKGLILKRKDGDYISPELFECAWKEYAIQLPAQVKKFPNPQLELIGPLKAFSSKLEEGPHQNQRRMYLLNGFYPESTSPLEVYYSIEDSDIDLNNKLKEFYETKKDKFFIIKGTYGVKNKRFWMSKKHDGAIDENK